MDTGKLAIWHWERVDVVMHVFLVIPACAGMTSEEENMTWGPRSGRGMTVFLCFFNLSAQVLTILCHSGGSLGTQ